MIDKGLVALLETDPIVGPMIGASVGVGSARIFQVYPPEYDPANDPLLSYSFVGGAAEPTISNSGVMRQRVEINAWSQNADTAADLREAVIHAVNGWTQRLADGTNVLNATLLNPGTDFFGEDRVYRRMCEFYVLYTH